MLMCAIAVLALGILSNSALAVGIFQASYNETISFQDMAANQHAVGIAFDGNHYWSCDGGNTSGVRLAEYDASGIGLATYQPGVSFRSCFTNNNTATLYARGYDSSDILVQTSPGVFSTHVTLTGGSLNFQSSVVLNSNGSGDYIAMNGGIVGSWSASGNYMGATTLIGFGTMFGEENYPASCRIASAAGYFLTYSDENLSAWDAGGNRIGTTVLNGAGSTLDANLSLSFANNMIFIGDNAGGTWRGYYISAIPEPATICLLGLGGLLIRRRKSA